MPAKVRKEDRGIRYVSAADGAVSILLVGGGVGGGMVYVVRSILYTGVNFLLSFLSRRLQQQQQSVACARE